MRWAFYVRSVPFSRDVLTGEASLGGSESACVGLMRGLARRGHRVVGFVADLAADCHGWTDADGVTWEPAIACRRDYLHHTWDVFVSLRMLDPFWGDSVPARYRILWNQDLLQDVGEYVPHTVSATWGVDRIAYVSGYHRAQWEGLAPDLRPLGWVTRNGYDPAHVPDPATVTKDWRRIVHISRPERGLAPLLSMWPALKARVPEAELRLCRYRSMYDGEGTTVKAICEDFDRQVEDMNARVGGITWLGSLGKAALYREIAEAAVMWYPGIASFAETSCIAAIEAQACGTPLVLSARGALPETAPHAALLPGDPREAAYQDASVQGVVDALHGCRDQRRAYRQAIEAGRAHVTPAYTYDAIAHDWERMVIDALTERAADHPTGVLRALLQVDDHVAARRWLHEFSFPPEVADAAEARCQRVIDGQDQDADDYGEHANTDVAREADIEPRFRAVTQLWGADVGVVLDVACGNGAAALRFLTDHPQMRIVGVDYSPVNIDRAKAAIEAAGFGDRTEFHCLPIYDFDRHTVAPEFVTWLESRSERFTGAFFGECLEHWANTRAIVGAVEHACAPHAQIIVTVPHGPFIDLLPRGSAIKRGHVHHFEIHDLEALFGHKPQFGTAYLHHGLTRRGDLVGTWLVTWRVDDPITPIGERDLMERAYVTRPQPRLSVGLITYNAANDLRRCLDSVWGIADEIVVGDTGSTDETIAIAEQFGARVLRLPRLIDLPGGFGEARNRVLDACTGDWFLWIDADEVLQHAVQLRKYLGAGPFRGYAIKQQHVMVDCPMTFDTPVRLFKREPSIRFYGAVHEQPQDGDPNADITPALQLHDVTIVHYGYPDEAARRKKSNRNLPLLQRNRVVCPERRLNRVLEVRECALRGADLIAQARGVTPEADTLLRRAVDDFEAHFADPADKYAQLARPFYEQALERLGEGWQFEFAFAGSGVELNGRHAQPTRFRARRYEDVERFVLSKVAEARKAMHPPPPITEPLMEIRV